MFKPPVYNGKLIGSGNKRIENFEKFLRTNPKARELFERAERNKVMKEMWKEFENDPTDIRIREIEKRVFNKFDRKNRNENSGNLWGKDDSVAVKKLMRKQKLSEGETEAADED